MWRGRTGRQMPHLKGASAIPFQLIVDGRKDWLHITRSSVCCFFFFFKLKTLDCM